MQILYPCRDSPGMEMGQVLLSHSLREGITKSFQRDNEEQTLGGRTGSPGMLTWGLVQLLQHGVDAVVKEELQDA